MNHDQLLALAELYAVGALDSQELQSFRDHLSSGCTDCEKVISQTQEDLSLAAFSLEPKTPHSFVKAALMEKISISGEQIVEPAAISLAERLKQWWPLGAFALAALFMSLAPMSVSLLSDHKPVSVHDKEMSKILSGDSLVSVALTASKEDADASAKLVWNKDACGGCLVIENLQYLSSGKVYQLWATKDAEKPVSLGTFKVDENGKAHMDIKEKTAALHFQSFAITKEPAGGVVFPTGSVYLSGKF